MRETMNQVLSQWKEVSSGLDEALLSPSRSSTGMLMCYIRLFFF